MINYTFSGVISLSFNWHSELCPVEDSAFHIIHLKALLLHFQAGTMTSTSASAVDVIGAGFIKLTDAGIECLGVEVIQLVGASQMTFCVFFGSADIEKEAGGICLCLVDKGLWSQYDDTIRWGCFC